MKTKQIIPIRKSYSGKAYNAYVRFTEKMLYINNDASLMLGDTDYIRMSIALDERLLLICKAEKAKDSFKLSRVNETLKARRIETNNALRSIIKAGFPLYMLGKRLPVKRLLDGSLAADFSMLVPIPGVKDGTES